MDLEKLRSELAERRGEWTRLAAEADTTRRTIYRIVNGIVVPNMRTAIGLHDAIRRSKRRERAAA